MRTTDSRHTGRRLRMTCVTSTLLVTLIASQSAHAVDQAPVPSKDGDMAAVPAQPRQTSASFGDWVVRCDHVGLPPQSQRVCEAAQSIVVKDQPAPIAQIAFGRMPADKADSAMMLTVLLPLSIAFDKPPRIGPGPAPVSAATDDPGSVALAFRRCLPGGCLADAKLDAASLKALRDAKGPGHLAFTDAGERTIGMPVSFRGLAQALDDLAAEIGKTPNAASGR